MNVLETRRPTHDIVLVAGAIIVARGVIPDELLGRVGGLSAARVCLIAAVGIMLLFGVASHDASFTLASASVRRSATYCAVAALVLLAPIALLDSLDGTIRIAGYSVILPCIVLSLTPYLRHWCGGRRLDIIAFYILCIYVCCTGLFLAVSGLHSFVVDVTVPGTSVHYQRIRITGSETTHAVLCTVFALWWWALARAEVHRAIAVVSAPAFLAAVFMALVSASRQTIIVALLAAVLIRRGERKQRPGISDPVRNSPWAGLRWRRVVALGAVAAIVRSSSGDLIVRVLAIPGTQYTSGRSDNLSAWLQSGFSRWTGIGMGESVQISQRSSIGLPHNEVVRLYIEAGYIGAILAVLIVASVMLTLWALSSSGCGDVERAVATIAGSAFVVQALINNVLQDAPRSVLFALLLGAVDWSASSVRELR